MDADERTHRSGPKQNIRGKKIHTRQAPQKEDTPSATKKRTRHATMKQESEIQNPEYVDVLFVSQGWVRRHRHRLTEGTAGDENGCDWLRLVETAAVGCGGLK
jgi:hypothetical protein